MKICVVLFLSFISLVLHAENKKIALLFLTRSDLNHTEMWKKWIDSEKYTVYNHSKDQVIDPWFKKFRIKTSCATSWAFHMQAQQLLLKAALENSNNYKFIFLSESCVPLKTSAEVYDTLTKDVFSYMAWAPVWWPKKSPRTLVEFPSEYHLGNPQWIILNRKHAEMIAKDKYWLKKTAKHMIQDEAYPSTFFNMNGVLHEFKKQATTYVHWMGGAHPESFTEATEEVITRLEQAKKGSEKVPGVLFARKFNKEFPSDVIEAIQSSFP